MGQEQWAMELDLPQMAPGKLPLGWLRVPA